MLQKIIGYHMDAENHWVADLICGHKQHVRHDPPFFDRPWVLTEEGRQSRLGTELNCKLCAESAEAVFYMVQRAAVSTAMEAMEEAGTSGLCREGMEELVLDRLKSLPAAELIEKALNTFTASREFLLKQAQESTKG